MRGPSWKALANAALLVGVPFTLACAGDSGDSGQAGASGEQPAVEAAPTQSVSVEWTALNDSGVTGDAEFTLEDGTLEVAVLAYNMGGPGDYGSHIHEGTCAEIGSVVVPLNAAVAHEPGTGEAETTVDRSQLTSDGSYVVLVHTLTGEPAACAPVPASVLGGM